MFNRFYGRLREPIRLLSAEWKRSCYSLFNDHAHGLRFLGRNDAGKKIEQFLASAAVEVDFSTYIESGVLGKGCPIRKIYVNQLAANSPVEDQWNVGFAQVDGFVSGCLFTVLDGHSGRMCAHVLAWSLLDYVAASFLNTKQLMLALNHWRTHDADQPYHLARRLDLLASADRRRLGHAASPPAPQLSAHIRHCLQEYVKELVDRKDRNMDPTQCLTEAMLRMDDVLCSTHHNIDLQTEPIPQASSLPEDRTLARDLLRVALSGAVGITGCLFWPETEKQQRTQLHLANVGDCGAVLLRVADSSSDSLVFEPIPCSRVHQGACNPDEIARVAREHPDNSPNELFRDGGRLLGELAPSRAFGDARYKWPAKRVLELSKVLDRLSSSSRDAKIAPGSKAFTAASNLFPMPTPYTSPPYLTAEPEVTQFEITPADRYLILGTDGLWEMLSSSQVATVMQDALHESTSPATRLLWNCLTSVPPSIARVIAQDAKKSYHIDHPSPPPHPTKHCPNESDQKTLNHALKLLSLPPGLARYYRDDITVMVIELNSNGQ